MNEPATSHDASLAIRRFMQAGVGLLVIGLVLVALATGLPIASAHLGGMQAKRQIVPIIAPPSVNEGKLLATVAGSRLIRPSQIIPAVKDNGAAQRLLNELTLQSVVQLGGQPVAYVSVKNKGVQTIRKGQHLLDFMVESIDPHGVKLSLNGVVVNLTY